VRIATFLLICLSLLAGCYKPKSQSYPLGSEHNPIIMSFVPSTEAAEVMTGADELVAMLEKQTGLHITANIGTSYVGIVEAMGAGNVHVGWLPPVAYVFAQQRNGDLILLKSEREGRTTYRGQILVKADSPIKSVADLKGKRIAFPEQTSASGYYYPSALLKKEGIDPELDITPTFTGGHDSAVIALLKDSVDAACGYDDIREKLARKDFPGVMEETRVLAHTADIPNDNVSVIKTLPAELRQKIHDGLMAVAKTEAGHTALKELYDIDGFADATDADYDPVREMMAALGQDPEVEAKKLK
jgi:phosphonate transport system substrate-binding protein